MSRRRIAGLYVFTAVAASVVATFALQLWSARLDVPFEYTGDGLSTAAHIKTVLETGWYESQSLLGAPAGQVFHDFPTADNLHMVAARIIGFFTSDFAVAINVYYLAGFPLAALTALWFFRKVGISAPLGVALAIVFSIAPYHFQRSEGHLWLASYYIVPLSLGLVWISLRGDRLWGPAAGRPRGLGHLTGPTGRTALIVALTGTAQSYYAVFFLILLAFAGLARLVMSRDWRPFWQAASAGAATVVAMLANMLPDMIYGWIHGANPAALGRSHAEAEIYALKLSQLLLPWPGHRIGILRSIREKYDSTYPLPSEHPALGLLAAVGLVALFLVVAYAATSFRRPDRLDPRLNAVAGLGGLVFVSFLFATFGGLSTLVSFATTSLRGWNRMVILIALLCLAGLGLLVDRLLERLARSRGERGRLLLGLGAAALIVVVGFIDQTPADLRTKYAQTAAQFDADDAYFRSLDDRVDAGAMVLQLPYLPFPEYATATGILSNDVLIPYLHTHDIRWTGGGIKGRPASDWTGTLGAYDGRLAEVAAATGAAGVLVDRAALLDHGATLDAELREALGAPLASADGRWAFFDLSAAADRLAEELSTSERAELAALLVDPVILTPSATFAAGADENGDSVLVGNTWNPGFTLINARGETAPSSVRLEISVPAGSEAASFTVVAPDGSSAEVPIVDGVGIYERTIDAPSGTSALTISITGSDASSTVPIRVRSFEISDPRVVALLG